MISKLTSYDPGLVQCRQCLSRNEITKNVIEGFNDNNDDNESVP